MLYVILCFIKQRKLSATCAGPVTGLGWGWVGRVREGVRHRAHSPKYRPYLTIYLFLSPLDGAYPSPNVPGVLGDGFVIYVLAAPFPAFLIVPIPHYAALIIRRRGPASFHYSHVYPSPPGVRATRVYSNPEYAEWSESCRARKKLPKLIMAAK